MTYLFPILLLAMAVYVFYGAITAKGRLFAMENIKEDCVDQAKKYMRIMYFAIAALMFLMAITNFGQTVLYSQDERYYETTEAYATDFADIISDGKVTYDNKTYTVEGHHSTEEMNALLMAANAKHPEMFQSDTPASMFSCTGSGAQNKILQYYKESSVTDADGNPVYISTIGNVRSDANDGSFISKLYGTLSPTLLRVLSYVLMGLTIVLIALLFVVIHKFTDKEKAAKARTYASGNVMPKGAFNFDDDEKSDK